MNVLVVDDDRYVVAAIVKKIDWTMLGIENVYTAYNMRQAQKIFSTNTVNIMLCDIEMPQGTGLELLAWIRENEYDVQAIFLTNYADFNYAQKAIELESFDYFLKPIAFDKLTLILQRAIKKATLKKGNSSNDSELLLQNKEKAAALFWYNVLYEKVFPSKSAVAHMVEECGLDYQLSDCFLPVLIHAFPLHDLLTTSDKSIFAYGFQNVLRELFTCPEFTLEACVEYSSGISYLIVLSGKNTAESVAAAKKISYTVIEKTTCFLECELSCSIGIFSPLQSVSETVQQLVAMSVDRVKARNQVSLLKNYQPNEEPYFPPDIITLEELLYSDNSELFLSKTSMYLNDLLKNKKLSLSSMRLFRVDITQIIYSFLTKNNIEANKLFNGQVNDFLLENSLNSVEDMQKYLDYLVTSAVKYKMSVEKSSTVVTKTKRYIEEHYAEDLSRNKLAEMVFLNEDYLTRIFKKQMDISLSNFILQTRLNAAKDMLKNTTDAVNNVASAVGYPNYSHFSRLFKKSVGCSPNEYRKKLQDRGE